MEAGDVARGRCQLRHVHRAWRAEKLVSHSGGAGIHGHETREGQALVVQDATGPACHHGSRQCLWEPAEDAASSGGGAMRLAGGGI